MKTNELITKLRSTARYVAPPARELLIAAAEELERLGAELVDERYRHDRYVDFELAQSQELARLREERRWIPVEERLPDKEFWEHQKQFDDDLEVMVMIKGAKLPTTLCYTAEGDFYEMTEDGVTFYLVTHWKPMPESPKNGGNEK